MHRILGRTGLEVGAIGLGTEYLINLPPDHVAGVIRAAIAGGINYFDLFWPQPGFRDAMGAAFAGVRDRAILTAHLGATIRDGQCDVSRDARLSEEFFADFLTRYHTEYVDVVFLFNTNTEEDYEELMKPGGLLEVARRLQREGRARFIGLSGHNAATALKAVESGCIDVLLFPVNLISRTVPGTARLHEACRKHGVGLVGMKPYAGGRLLREEPSIEVEFFQMGRGQMLGAPTRFDKRRKITPVQCLSYALAQPGVSTVVPGCKDQCELAAALGWLEAGASERDFASLLSDFEHYPAGQCVYCNHCLPCPSKIDIGRTLELLDQAERELTESTRAGYGQLAVKASDCVECGECTARCPFGVEVEPRMARAAELFGA